jgi:hypothetical protein
MTKQLSLSNLSEDEKNARAAAAVTQYGPGTRSYNRSAQKTRDGSPERRNHSQVPRGTDADSRLLESLPTLLLQKLPSRTFARTAFEA